MSHRLLCSLSLGAADPALVVLGSWCRESLEAAGRGKSSEGFYVDPDVGGRALAGVGITVVGIVIYDCRT
jgi:hypothetical protein